jgi:hypothetical protein
VNQQYCFLKVDLSLLSSVAAKLQTGQPGGTWYLVPACIQQIAAGIYYLLENIDELLCHIIIAHAV